MIEKEDETSQYFLRLFLANQRRIYGYVMAMVSNVSDADDIVQDVASTMWTKFSEYRVGTDFTAWAITIARFKVLDLLRKQKTHRKHFNEKTLKIIEEIEAKEDLKQNTRLDVLQKCIQKLTSTERYILSVRYENGMTLKQVADRLGLSINTLYSRLSKIHLMLLNCVKRGMVEQ